MASASLSRSAAGRLRWPAEQGSQPQAVEELQCPQPIDRWHGHAPVFHDLDQRAAGRHDDERAELPIIDQAKRKLDPWLGHSGDKNPGPRRRARSS